MFGCVRRLRVFKRVGASLQRAKPHPPSLSNANQNATKQTKPNTHARTQKVVESAVAAVKHLKSLGCDDIEFSPEDAGRSDPEFLYRILGEVIAAGATTLNIPDTTGWNLPHEFGGLIAAIKANTPGIESESPRPAGPLWLLLLLSVPSPRCRAA